MNRTCRPLPAQRHSCGKTLPVSLIGHWTSLAICGSVTTITIGHTSRVRVEHLSTRGALHAGEVAGRDGDSRISCGPCRAQRGPSPSRSFACAASGQPSSCLNTVRDPAIAGQGIECCRKHAKSPLGGRANSHWRPKALVGLKAKLSS